MLWRGCSIKRRSKSGFKAQLIPSFYVDFKGWVSYCASEQKSKPQFPSYSLTYVITNFSSSEKSFPSVNLLMCPFPVVAVRLIRLTAQSHASSPLLLRQWWTQASLPINVKEWKRQSLKISVKTINLFLSPEENNKDLKLSISKQREKVDTYP